jgi:Zn-dependent M16 (insulinase) family peptidase
LDEEYFSHYDKNEKEIVIIPQEAHIDTNYTKEYEIGANEETKDNTYMSLCYGLDHYNNYEEYLAMTIICDALLTKNDSPLKKALLSANLGQNVEARIDDDNIIPALHIYLQKSNEDKKEEFKKVFEEEVRKLVENGIDKELLLATINHMEFVEKEMDTGRMPKGLILAMTMMGSFNYNTDLKEHLEFSKHFAKFKQELNNNYFENMLEKYILNSKHHVQVVINPDPTLSSKKKKAMDDLKQEVVAIATMMAGKVVAASINEKLSNQLIEDTLKEMGDDTWRS